MGVKVQPILTDPYHTPIITQPSSSQPQKRHKSRRPKEKDTQEDAFISGGNINDIDKDAEITLVDETQGRHDDDIMFDVSDLAVSTTSTIPVSVATITEDEITLAQALAELKSVKPKLTTATTATTKGILFQEPSESITTTKTTIPSKDKGKAEFDEEERLAREKDKANVALIEE
ncbi:hypothetical protein Tco_0954783 [Tanacetum coccineum]|uniref:Uncharacterized protein n=1 Tax=Tanacetum coccineum TaxID=301880 RepID=A0ABQ5E5B8_9ASTR